MIAVVASKLKVYGFYRSAASVYAFSQITSVIYQWSYFYNLITGL